MGGRKGQTVLDSRETHWKYAISYLPEACFKEGERVPLMCIRAGKTLPPSLPPSLLLCPRLASRKENGCHSGVYEQVRKKMKMSLYLILPSLPSSPFSPGAEYSFRIPQDQLQGKLYPTPPPHTHPSPPPSLPPSLSF